MLPSLAEVYRLLWPTFITSAPAFRDAISWDGPEEDRSRESIVLEFKGGPIDKEKLVERVNGMANANGGVILVRVSRMKHQPQLLAD